MRNAGLEEAQVESRFMGNINNLRYANDSTLMAESEELNSLLMWVKEESDKAGSNLNIHKTKIMASGPITSWQIDGETVEIVVDLWLQPWNLQTLTPWKKSYNQHRQHIKKKRHYFANKCPFSQGCGFSSGHVWMWELDYKESWALKNWCFWIVVLEKTLESPFDIREI